nr:serine--tRNA ligase; mitochondrial-like [Biomphalaria glabrata]
MAVTATSLLPFKCLSTIGSTACRVLHANTRTTYSRFSFLNQLKRLARIQFAAHHNSAETLTFEKQPASWLFVNNTFGGLYGSHVNLELDLENRLSVDNIKQLELILRRRGVPADLSSLVDDFTKLRALERQRNGLVSERNEIAEKLKQMKAEHQDHEPGYQAAAHELLTKLTSIKERIKDLQMIWDLEEQVMVRSLKLPNDIHPTTPDEESTVLREVNNLKGSTKTVSHTEIGKKYNLIKFSNVGPKAYYLKGALAKTELALMTSLVRYFQKHKFYFISGPEFFRTNIMEGCGLDVHNPTEVLTILDNVVTQIEPMIHLAGISTATFVAYVAKCCIGDNYLPLNMFSCGRRYQNSHLPGLYGANQTTQVGIFSCLLQEDLDKQFDTNIELIWNFLAPLGFPIRLTQVKAADLQLAESRRVEIQIYAPSLQKYIPIGNVSDLSDFVSRRLMVRHNQNHPDYRFAPMLHMISGTGVNVTALLAVWMEHSNTDLDKFHFLPLPV